MKFLLVALNAKYIHSNPALYSLRAYAGEGLQEHVEIAEYTINHAFSDILADIYKRKPDVIGFSCYIWNIRMITELIGELVKVLPQVPVWLGGPEVTYDAPELLKKYPAITGVMIGEGEETFRELLEYYVKKSESFKADRTRTEGCEADGTGAEGFKGYGTELHRMKGLCLPDGFTAPRELTDMSTLPFLYNDLTGFENKIIYYESGRGCPFRCSYCLSSIDKQVRLRDIEIVKKELQFFLDRRVKQVKFVDRTFNCNHRHAAEIWKYILEHDNGVTNFHFEVAADILSEEELSLLHRMRPGLVQLEIGVQSTNPETLSTIHRTMDVEKLERIVAYIHSGNNIHQHLDLIAGLPYEDYESFGRSFDRVYAMRPNQLQLGFLKVLKGSEMCERAQEYGINYTDMPPYEVLFTDWLGFSDIVRLKHIEEMVELYYNSNQFVHTLRFLEQAFSSPFQMFQTLAEFYEYNGYYVNSPSRGYRYQVLLSFACAKDKEHEAVYKELLTYDMYLRENVKSRPEFARDLQEYKDAVRDFYRQEEECRVYLPDCTGYDSKQLARMTHLEPFYFPVWEMPDRSLLGTGENGKNLTYILFDYQNRCPLTGNARTVKVPGESYAFENRLVAGKSEKRKYDLDRVAKSKYT